MTRSCFNWGNLPPNYVVTEEKANSISHLADVVTIEEVKDTFLSASTSPGLDEISVKDVKSKVPVRALAKLFTLRSRFCWVPQYFLDSKTYFIPNVGDGTSLMCGSEYISSIKVRYNCLFSRSRRTRRRALIRHCSRGYVMPETMNHILQICYATHGLHVRRHNDFFFY